MASSIEVLPKNTENCKSFRVMQIFYRILYFSSGLDFGFFEQKSYKQRFFWKILTAVISVFYICLVLILMDFTRQHLPGAILYLCNYFLHVLLLTSTSQNKTFSQLHCDLKQIDIKLQKSSASFNLEKKLLACSMFNAVLMYTVYFIYCVHRNNCLRPVLARYIFLWLVVLAVNMICVSYTFAFYALSCRLKNLACVLKTDHRDTLSMKFIYKSIVELAEMQKSSCSPMVRKVQLFLFSNYRNLIIKSIIYLFQLVLSLLFTTFEVMVTILYGVKQMKMETSVRIIITNWRRICINISSSG